MHRPPAKKKPIHSANTQDCCVAPTRARHEAALAMVAGYCRRRTLEEVEAELAAAAGGGAEIWQRLAAIQRRQLAAMQRRDEARDE